MCGWRGESWGLASKWLHFLNTFLVERYGQAWGLVSSPFVMESPPSNGKPLLWNLFVKQTHLFQLYIGKMFSPPKSLSIPFYVKVSILIKINNTLHASSYLFILDVCRRYKSKIILLNFIYTYTQVSKRFKSLKLVHHKHYQFKHLDWVKKKLRHNENRYKSWLTLRKISWIKLTPMEKLIGRVFFNNIMGHLNTTLPPLKPLATTLVHLQTELSAAFFSNLTLNFISLFLKL